jgi:hypothetical protein
MTKPTRTQAAVSSRRVTELGDAVTTVLSIREGRIHEDITIEGPVELLPSQRRYGAGKCWPSGGEEQP